MISEELIMSQLDLLLTMPEPGATIHHMHVSAAPAGSVGPLGLIDEDQIVTSVYVIAPLGTPGEEFDVDDFIVKSIQHAARKHAAQRRVPVFAALNQQSYSVHGGTEQSLQLARELARQGRLVEHPDVVESVLVYGACRDGRRWRSRRDLTGPDADVPREVELLVGAPRPDEAFGTSAAVPLQQLVGIGLPRPRTVP